MKRRALPLLLAAPAFAQGRVTRLVVGFPPGGLSDVIARIVVGRLADALGHPVIVDNRGGAGGTLGTGQALRSAPDGSVLSWSAPGTHITGPLLFPNVGYDGIDDVTPVGSFCAIASICAVHPSLAVNSVAELVAHCRARPGQVNFGSAGSGGSVHLAGEMFKLRAGVDITHVPYRGGAAMLTDLLAGRVQLAFDNLPQIMPHVRSGAVRALAVTTTTRSRFAPELPTMIEAGVADFDVSAWFGITAPAGLAVDIQARLSGALRAMLRDPSVVEQLTGMGAEPLELGPAEFLALMRAERRRYGALIAQANIRAD